HVQDLAGHHHGWARQRPRHILRGDDSRHRGKPGGDLCRPSVSRHRRFRNIDACTDVASPRPFLGASPVLIVRGQTMSPNDLSLSAPRRDLRLPFGAALAAAACLAPLFLGNYALHAIIIALIFLLPAHGLNLLVGYTGLLSLAQAAFFGIPTWRYNLVVFMISAAFAGLGGSVYAHYLTVVSPLTFQMYYSTTMLIIVLGGGAGTISGVIFGSVLFVGLSEALRIAPEVRMIAYGLCLLALVFWFPKGFAPLIDRFWYFLKERK